MTRDKYASITDKEWEYIIHHLADGAINSLDYQKDYFSSIQKKLTKIQRHKKTHVYRGMRIDRKYLDKLLDNKPFTLYKKDRASTVSWSLSGKPANEFFYAFGDQFGIFLETDLRKQEIIMDVTYDTVFLDTIFEKADELGLEFGDVSLSQLKREEEIVAWYKPRRRYGLCKNVVKLSVNDTQMTKTTLGKLLDRIDNGDYTTVQEQLDKWGNVQLNCDKQGKLKLYGRE